MRMEEGELSELAAEWGRTKQVRRICEGFRQEEYFGEMQELKYFLTLIPIIINGVFIYPTDNNQETPSETFLHRQKMSPRSTILSLTTLILLAIFVPRSGSFPSSSSSDEDLLSELQDLQSKSPSGVIHLTDRLISRFLTSPPIPRPYHLIIFFDATSLRSKTELHLPKLHSEFSIVSESFSSHHHNLPSASKLFFCDIEFTESQSTFSNFGVNSLPHIRIVSPLTKSLRDSESMDSSSFSQLPEAMADFIQSKTKLSVGPIRRPPVVTSRQLMILVTVFLIASPFIIKKILAGQTLIHDSRVWMAGSVFVYFFSVSGSMHNIIRNMPMMMSDREGRPVFFYQGSGMQLGVEGLIVGFLYTLVGLVLAFMTHGLVRVRSVAVQRGVMLGAMVVVYWAVAKVISLNNWKTGYSVHAFWPTSWK